ncbi:hypothetical protein GCM10010349_57190 [Streptomyces flavofungini]|nr:hypothetical protein GCM10010349_57190 [Streptomyces flavofungini]
MALLREIDRMDTRSTASIEYRPNYSVVFLPLDNELLRTADIPRWQWRTSSRWGVPTVENIIVLA